MKKLAILVCLAMLICMFAVNAYAAENVSSNIDFTALASVSAAGDATKAVMEGMGLIIPEGSSWEITDHFYKLAMPAGGYADTYYIQTLEAGEGKVLAADATLELAHAMAALTEGGAAYDVGWVNVSVSTDGTAYTEVWANEQGQGKEYTADVFAIPQITLTGTKGAAKIWVKVGVNRHGGPGTGAIGWSKISASVETPLPANAVQSVVDMRNTDKIAAGSGGELTGDAAKAEIERLGFTVPADSNAWKLNDCYHIFATPQEGYQTCSVIQTLEAGEGKVFSENVSLTAGYWLAAVGDPSWFWVEVSTDGENWNEVYVDETGRGEEWQDTAYGEGTISLDGTAGASKVYVKFCVERHSGQTSGGLTFSKLVGLTKAGTPSTGDSAPETADMIGIVVALLAISGTGITVLKKRN